MARNCMATWLLQELPERSGQAGVPCADPAVPVSSVGAAEVVRPRKSVQLPPLRTGGAAQVHPLDPSGHWLQLQWTALHQGSGLPEGQFRPHQSHAVIYQVLFSSSPCQLSLDGSLRKTQPQSLVRAQLRRQTLQDQNELPSSSGPAVPGVTDAQPMGNYQID
ncbi:unnamed protein product [Leptidea sinapis]|uniref:Uncharacterized protein n=1 Tax=Leptidea sinapis TaxID=189913 RepID=A0A5E4QDJ5_9NEOP|nr:unnamed protein product [Leptidea sinapis]